MGCSNEKQIRVDINPNWFATSPRGYTPSDKMWLHYRLQEKWTQNKDVTNRGNFSTHFNWKHLKFQLPISKDMDFMAQGWLWYPLGLPLGKHRALKLWKFTSIQLLNWSTAYIPNFKLPSLKIWLSWPRGGFSAPRDCPWMPQEPQGIKFSSISTAQIPIFSWPSLNISIKLVYKKIHEIFKGERQVWSNLFSLEDIEKKCFTVFYDHQFFLYEMWILWPKGTPRVCPWGMESLQHTIHKPVKFQPPISKNEDFMP